ncbi:MAG: universal stress protein [Desulfosarcina sp.]|nr:universal stress protein [Desulfosarcina sp.]MBC2742735.1 universal stress protein [Desulfosarcina sp.]MBC2765645.1 universal stress protein [Desulfosarcina sp.]
MFKKILVPVDIDYPETAAQVYQKAVAIGKLGGAEIRLVTVMPGFSMPIVASLVPEDVRQEATARIKAAMEQFIADHCDKSVTYSLRTGKNWEEIISVADKWQADLIIVYHNRHREINEMFSRSCSQRVADHANCSVVRLRNIQV